MKRGVRPVIRDEFACWALLARCVAVYFVVHIFTAHEALVLGAIGLLAGAAEACARNATAARDARGAVGLRYLIDPVRERI